jgi:hypothetical protein
MASSSEAASALTIPISYTAATYWLVIASAVAEQRLQREGIAVGQHVPYTQHRHCKVLSPLLSWW